MAELQLAGLLADFVHREVYDPAELIAVGLHMAFSQSADVAAENACCFLSGLFLACTYADKIAGFQAQCFFDCLSMFLKELGDAAGQSAVFVYFEPVSFVSGLNFHVSAELVDDFAGAFEAVSNDCFYDISLEGTETAVSHALGSILHEKVDTEIRFIGSVFFHGIFVGDAAEGRFGSGLVGAEFLKYRRENVFQNGEDIFLAGESHLHIQLIELARRTVCTGILITEAGGDLEIAVETGGHEQLFELLGSLRKCIKFARVVSGGNEIVSRTFRRGAGQDRSRDLQETMLHHAAAKLGNHVAAQNDLGFHSRITKIQVAVFQTGIFISFLGTVDLKRKLIVDTFAEDLDLLGNNLDLTGGKVCVFAGTLTDSTGNGDGRFGVDLGDLLHHFLRLDHDLSGSVEVAKDQEAQILADSS